MGLEPLTFVDPFLANDRHPGSVSWGSTAMFIPVGPGRIYTSSDRLYARIPWSSLKYRCHMPWALIRKELQRFIPTLMETLVVVKYMM